MDTNNSAVNVSDNDLVDAELDALLNGLDDEDASSEVAAKGTELPDGMNELDASTETITPVKEKPKAKKPRAKKPVAKKAKEVSKVTDNKKPDPTDKKSAKGKETDSKKKESKPRLNLTGMKPSVAIKTILGDELGPLILTEEEHGFSAQKKRPLIEKRLAGFDELAKKQGEKVINMMKWLHNGSKLKAFTQMAIQHLIDKGETTSAELKQHYLDRPYGVGTANSISNQMMTLLPELGIATRDGKTLTLNKGSTIVAKFKAAA